jgi:cytochrome c551/c552
MCTWASRLLPLGLLALLAPGLGLAQMKYPGIGRTATPAEIRAWDIDVRPDFTGLPRGSGSVRQGQEVWDSQCASCHGTFGESNSVFPPIVGGTTSADQAAGRAKGLLRPDQGRTTLMKLPHLSTLWDYINRAMPWNAPKTLSVQEVYAVTAYILHLGEIVPETFVLSDANIGEVQQRLPNRHGMSLKHGLWDTRGTPDVRSTACMKDCEASVTVASRLPDYAKNAHGDLAAQHRLAGPVRGVHTPPAVAVATSPAANPARSLAEKSGCLACHGIADKSVGPGLREVAAKYKGHDGAEAMLAAKVKGGGVGTWGQIPMPPNERMRDDEIRTLVKWILGGAG